MAVLKAEGSRMWWDMTEKMHDAESNTLCWRSRDALTSPVLTTTTSQRIRHYLNSFGDFLVLTSSSGHLLNICLQIFAGSPISRTQVPVSCQLLSLDPPSPSH